MHIEEHLQGAPHTIKVKDKYREQHAGQQHGRPPLSLVDIPNIVACSMHGEHNIVAQTYFATVTQHLYDNKVVDQINAVVCEEWKMKRHKHQVQTTKDTPHFNGPEEKRVLVERNKALDIVFPPSSQDAKVREARADAHLLWEL